jgi:hypothetical protein
MAIKTPYLAIGLTILVAIGAASRCYGTAHRSEMVRR